MAIFYHTKVCSTYSAYARVFFYLPDLSNKYSTFSIDEAPFGVLFLCQHENKTHQSLYFLNLCTIFEKNALYLVHPNLFVVVPVCTYFMQRGQMKPLNSHI